MADCKNIWVFTEQSDGVIDASFFELITKVKELFTGFTENQNIVAVIFGGKNNSIIDELKESGVDTILSVEHERLSIYHPDYYAYTLSELAKAKKPEMILISATANGSELAPTVAAKLKTGLAAHCTDICIGENHELIMIIPAFGGKLLGEILIPEARPIMVTVKPGVFKSNKLPPVEKVEVIHTESSFLDSMQTGIEFVNRHTIVSSDVPIESAEMAICVGLGICSQENWEKANKLAYALKASICYTRPVVDLGYVDNENSMVGTSGKMIRPKLYLGFGVSGSAHHICGMKDSGLIININTNEKAEIFNVSNYKVVGDSGVLLDELLNAISFQKFPQTSG
jgi:electron transfer flavoprotein alpha subunit